VSDSKPRVELELTKMLVQPVIQRRENGKVVDEVVNDAIPIYDSERVKELWAEIEAQVDQLNAAAKPPAEAEALRRLGPPPTSQGSRRI
jgi:hypothetical protein